MEGRLSGCAGFWDGQGCSRRGHPGALANRGGPVPLRKRGVTSARLAASNLPDYRQAGKSVPLRELFHHGHRHVHACRPLSAACCRSRAILTLYLHVFRFSPPSRRPGRIAVLPYAAGENHGCQGVCRKINYF